MAVREILKMGDPRLLRVALQVPESMFDSDQMHELITDLLDTMKAANGAGIAAPQIGVDLRVVIFGGTGKNPRYPDAPDIPFTVLCNPVLETLGDAKTAGWEGCLSVPGLRGEVPRFERLNYSGRGDCIAIRHQRWNKSSDQLRQNFSRAIDAIEPLAPLIFLQTTSA